MKTCSACKIEKTESEFHKDRKTKSGFRSWCKACCKTHSAGRYIRNPGYYKAYSARWRSENPERWLEIQLRRYNLTVLEYKKLLSKQNGVCAICTKPPLLKRRLVVDHIHSTGQTRGLLCGKCNQAIGLFEERSENLFRAIAYLERGK